MIGNILGNVDIITFGVMLEQSLPSLDGYLDGSNDGKLEILFLGD